MEENGLKKLPEDGISLAESNLGLDYEDGYEGLIKYIDGEIVLENIHNDTYCGNGTSEELSVVKYGVGECQTPTPNSKCFIMGTTEREGDTIIGYNYDEPTCDPRNIVIPATVNGVDVNYIGDGAFIEEYDILLGFFFADDYWPQEVIDVVGNEDFYENRYGAILGYAFPLVNFDGSVTKFCHTEDDSIVRDVDLDYVLEDSDSYDKCFIPFPDMDFWDYEEYVYHDIDIVDFSQATNLKEIGVAAFYGNVITEVIFGNNQSIEKIGASAFESNAVTGMLDLSGLSRLTEIGGASFYSNSIEALKLPDNLEYIGRYAFEENNLTEIIIPESVTTIDEYAFGDNYWESIIILGEDAYRFDYYWNDIGWPESLKIAASNREYALSTTETNTLSFMRGNYLLTVPTSGNYKIELWGAAGGGADPGKGGNGGFISANLSLTAGTEYLLVIGEGGSYIGGAEVSKFATQGGGGAGYGYGGSGGGATILAVYEEDKSFHDLTIVAVAGGGGGASDQTGSGYSYLAGNGGYLYSGLGNLNGTNSSYGTGGTQTSGGVKANGVTFGNSGSYLQGGTGVGHLSECSAFFSDCNSAGGGGGGYYGGAGGTADNDAGAGGSSYVNSSFGSLNEEAVPSSIPLKVCLGANSYGENGYARITYIG